MKLRTSALTNEIGLKGNMSDVYYKNVLFTQSEIHWILSSKLDSSVISNYYTQSQTNNLFVNYYNKTYVDI